MGCSYIFGDQIYNNSFIYNPGFGFQVSYGINLSESVGIGLGTGYSAMQDNNLRLTNRFRFQWATVDDNKPKAYLRNKVTMDYKIADNLNPYIALEPYYNLRLQQIKVIRGYLGNEMPLFNTVIDLYYIAELRLKG